MYIVHFDMDQKKQEKCADRSDESGKKKRKRTMALPTCATNDVAWTLRISDDEIRDLFTKLNEDMTENDIKTTIEEFVRKHDKYRSSSKDPEEGFGNASDIASVSTNQDEATEEYLSWADLWKNAKKNGRGRRIG